MYIRSLCVWYKYMFISIYYLSLFIHKYINMYYLSLSYSISSLYTYVYINMYYLLLCYSIFLYTIYM